MSNSPVTVVDSVPGIVQAFYAASVDMSASIQARRKAVVWVWTTCSMSLVNERTYIVI